MASNNCKLVLISANSFRFAYYICVCMYACVFALFVSYFLSVWLRKHVAIKFLSLSLFHSLSLSPSLVNWLFNYTNNKTNRKFVSSFCSRNIFAVSNVIRSHNLHWCALQHGIQSLQIRIIWQQPRFVNGTKLKFMLNIWYS